MSTDCKRVVVKIDLNKKKTNKTIRFIEDSL